MSIRDQAVAAHEARMAEEDAGRAEAEAEARRRVEAAWEQAHKLLAQSPLAQWFPGEEWEVYDTTADHYGWLGLGEAVVCSGRPGGTDPDYANVPCFMLGAPDATGQVPVWLVMQHSSEGYRYWEGPRVFSAADVGRVLKQREEAQARAKR